MSHLPADFHRRFGDGQPTGNPPAMRPHPDRMAPFHWIYWALLDAGRDQLADAVMHLIRSREQALRDQRWHAQRQSELQAEIHEIRASMEEQP